MEYSGQANYGLAKAGVVGLSKVIAKVRDSAHHYQSRKTDCARNGALNSASAQTRKRSFSIPSGNHILTFHSVAFGHILTRLTAAKEEGAFVTAPDGSKIPLGIPQKQKDAAGPNAHADIPLRRPGTPTEAASVILAVASPLFSYVDGQTIMVTGGRNM